MSNKQCFKCGLTKDRSEFYKHGKMADGLLGKCKKCTKTDVQKHREKNRERIVDYDRMRNQLPHRRAKVDAYHRDNPKVIATHQKVYRAVQAGLLVRPSTCSKCNKTCNPDGHHDDYDKPLEVIWLCRSCHLKHHETQKTAI